MSNNNSSSGIGGLLGIVACIAAFFVARKFFPSLGKLLLIAGIVLVVLIVAIVIIVIACSKSTAKDKKKTGLSDEASAVLSKGRTQLMDLRRNGMCIKNQQIRTESEVICKSVDKILRTLREQPEDIPEARQFFNYYLPTFGKIISKYLMLEKSGKLHIIDFNRSDFGDPWEEFNRIVWCAQKSPLFASGMVNGYFDGNVPMEFWKLTALYIASNTLGSVSWAIPFGQDEVDIMLAQAQDILRWYNNMQNPVPAWYTDNLCS